MNDSVTLETSWEPSLISLTGSKSEAIREWELRLVEKVEACAREVGLLAADAHLLPPPSIVEAMRQAWQGNRTQSL
jgi:hypothetical protein